MIREFFMCAIISSGVSVGGTEQTPFSYVLTPGKFGSHWLLVMVHADNNTESGKCLEVQDDGLLKEVWSVEWFAPRGFVYLHPDGKSLLRIHSISAHKPLLKENYENNLVLSFYREGKISKEIEIGQIISEYDYLERLSKDYRVIRKIEALGEFSMEDMGFSKYDHITKETLRKESIFCITTVEGDKFFYTSSGDLVNRVKINK